MHQPATTHLIAAGRFLLVVALAVCVTDTRSSGQAVDERSADALVTTSYGQWSEPVDGLRGRLILKRKHATNGTPIITTYLELQNVRDLINPMAIAWTSTQTTFQVNDKDGKALAPTMGPYSGLAFSGAYQLTLPYDSQMVFSIAGCGAGIPADQAGLIDLGPTQSWTIPHDGKTYALSGSIEIVAPKAKRRDGIADWSGKLDLPAVAMPRKAQALDATELGRLIDELGQRMMAKPNTTPGEQAAHCLSLIDDPRVIPWYVKAVASDSSQLRRVALGRLRRFNSDAALEGIRIGMNTQSDDIADATGHIKAQAAAAVRHSAAIALARSPHPKAKALLLTMKDDRYHGVRLTVLHAYAPMKTAQSRQLLQAMAADPNEMVRNEAKRLLQKE